MQVSPSVYEHAAKMIGRNPWEVSRDEDLIFEAPVPSPMRRSQRT